MPDGDPMPCEQFEVAFQALSQWLADRAVLPIESSVGGSIHAVYDLLLKCALSPAQPRPWRAAALALPRASQLSRRLCPCACTLLVAVVWYSEATSHRQ